MRTGRTHPIGFVAVIVLAIVAAGCAATQSPINPTLGAEWRDANGQLRWPPNDGCAGVEAAETLQPGTVIDRYGSDTGSFFATPGTPYAARSLPYDPTKLPYSVYAVRKPLAVEECTIAPWFGEPGGGTQFKAAEPAGKLKAEGVIAAE